MKISEGPLAGLMIIEPSVFPDERGYFFEIYQQKRYQNLMPTFVQDNISHSKKNVLRGLHYQLPDAQGKLISIIEGSVFDVVVDIRRSSKTFGKWFGITLSKENRTQLYIPPGFAHGFCVLSESASCLYKCTEFYSPATEHGLAWNDERLNISWPIANPILSAKDKTYLALHEIPDAKLFT